MSDATVSFGSKLVRFGPFEYELETGILRRNGADVAVPRRAAHILARLLERPGELVSKEDLLEAGWPGVAVSDQSLNEAVKVLRRILEDDSREPTYIQTVYGRGLRFLAPVRPVKAPRTSQSRRLKIAGAVGAALGLFLFYHFRGEPNVAPETLKPTIAILPFENEGDDPSLDWLRLGIAGLLATDLSQSTEIAVTPTARLMPIVRGLNLSDDAARSE
ncbi:MAG TPA: winged helix-turn-helix domain-containing protein, partial [Vicinamibacteria bacterium]|nr:winged helix-turn-helix domain-containing protein [Vicinamibacteria bacterium]